MSVNPAPQKRERVSVVCVFEGKILCFHAVDPDSGRQYYFLPGGGLETGETETACGERETLEETGYKVRVKASSKLTRKYLFHWDGRDFDCVTHFYRGYLDEAFHPPKPVVDQDYNKGPLWIPLNRVQEVFAYSNEILDAVNFLI